jgi:hypothetical protein
VGAMDRSSPRRTNIWRTRKIAFETILSMRTVRRDERAGARWSTAPGYEPVRGGSTRRAGSIRAGSARFRRRISGNTPSGSGGPRRARRRHVDDGASCLLVTSRAVVQEVRPLKRENPARATQMMLVRIPAP